MKIGFCKSRAYLDTLLNKRSRQFYHFFFFFQPDVFIIQREASETCITSIVNQNLLLLCYFLHLDLYEGPNSLRFVHFGRGGVKMGLMKQDPGFQEIKK